MFLTFLTVIIVALSLGLVVYYFVQNRENIALSSETITVNKEDTFTVKIIVTEPNRGTTVSLLSDNSILEKVSVSSDGFTYQYKAIAAGSTTITLETSNPTFNNLYCTVRVGDGSTTNPFYIKNDQELADIGSANRPLNANYLQIDNIDLVTYPNWTPIGGEQGFSGNYDGAGHTIFGLSIVAGSYVENAGLFSKINAGANVQRIVLDRTSVAGNIKYAGSVAGTNSGTISRIEVKQGRISTLCAENGTSVGGIAGTMTRAGTNTKLDRVSFVSGQQDAVLLDSEAVAYAGGLVGSNYGGTIINSYSRGGVKVNLSGVNAKAGGIVGLNTYTTETVSENKYHTNLKGNIINCYSTAVITSEADVNKGSIVGQNRNPISNGSSYTNEVDTLAGTIQENRYVGVYYLFIANDEFNGIQWTYGNADMTDLALVQGKSVAELQTQSTFRTSSYAAISKSWDFDRVWAISEGVNDGYPTLRMFGESVSDDIYDPQATWLYSGIDSMTKLAAIASDLNGIYDIIADFTISANWTPLGTAENPFNGTLRGNGKTITFDTGIGINSYFQFAGLFGYLGPNANLIDITIQNISISAGGNVGALAGFSAGVIEDCSVSGNIAFKGGIGKNVGGLVGQNVGQITSSDATVSITADEVTGGIWNIGGLVGYNSGNISNSISKKAASINSTNTDGTVNAGGLVGASVGSAIVSGCESYGSVTLSTTAGNFAGGLVGYMEGSAKIIGSRAGAEFDPERIIRGYFAGGLAGYISMIDETDSSDKTLALAQCQVFDNIRVEGEKAGGLVGRLYRGKVENCATYAHLYAKVMAGFSVTVEGSTDSNGNGRYAIMDTCFSGATFDNSIAGSKVFAETQSIIRGTRVLLIWDAWSDAAADPVKHKEAGFIKNSKYNKGNLDATGVAEKDYRSPTSQQNLPFVTMVYKDGATSDTDCKKAGTFNASIWKTTVWKIENGYYPQVKLV